MSSHNNLIVLILILSLTMHQTTELEQIMEVYNSKDATDAVTLFTANFLYLPERRVMVNHLLFVNNQGQILKEKMIDDGGYQTPFMFNDTTVVGLGDTGHFFRLWNMENDKYHKISRLNNSKMGHHEIIYNSVRNTFMTIGRSTIETENATWNVDTLWEFDWKGNIIWKWNMSDYVNTYKNTHCPSQTHYANWLIDYSHSNSIDWDLKANIIYLNARYLDNVWAIKYPTKEVLWLAGRNGNFTMYDKYGSQKNSLWSHSHSFKRIPDEENEFILFDNNYHSTPIDGKQFSRIVEVIIDTKTMTMNETWSWNSPPEYFSPIAGSAQRLPNGNRLASFASRMYRYGETSPFAEGGAVIVEVDDKNIVWELKFPQEYEIQRATKIPIKISTVRTVMIKSIVSISSILIVYALITYKKRKKNKGDQTIVIT